MRESSSTFEVLLTEGAEQDLESIYDYIAQFDCAASADYVLDQLASVIESLATFPERGGHPKELLAVGIKEYRQTSFKPYPRVRQLRSQVIVFARAH